jgi:hypothetical protein
MELTTAQERACDERVQSVQAVQGVQPLSLVLPRVAGEETGGGWNDWNFWNDWNYVFLGE